MLIVAFWLIAPNYLKDYLVIEKGIPENRFAIKDGIKKPSL